LPGPSRESPEPDRGADEPVQLVAKDADLAAVRLVPEQLVSEGREAVADVDVRRAAAWGQTSRVFVLGIVVLTVSCGLRHPRGHDRLEPAEW
jgi:hypothetical protein